MARSLVDQVDAPAVADALPAWLRLLVHLVRDVGFPIVVALVLLWSHLHLLPAKIDALIATMQHSNAELRELLLRVLERR